MIVQNLQPLFHLGGPVYGNMGYFRYGGEVFNRNGDQTMGFFT